MLRSSLFNYSEAYLPVSETLTITGVRADDAEKQLDERIKRVIFKNCAQFTDCISEINNTHIDNTKYLDVDVPIYN